MHRCPYLKCNVRAPACYGTIRTEPELDGPTGLSRQERATGTREATQGSDVLRKELIRQLPSAPRGCTKALESQMFLKWSLSTRFRRKELYKLNT